jgi:hypothetical protein
MPKKKKEAVKKGPEAYVRKRKDGTWSLTVKDKDLKTVKKMVGIHSAAKANKLAEMLIKKMT